MFCCCSVLLLLLLPKDSPECSGEFLRARGPPPGARPFTAYTLDRLCAARGLIARCFRITRGPVKWTFGFSFLRRAGGRPSLGIHSAAGHGSHSNPEHVLSNLRSRHALGGVGSDNLRGRHALGGVGSEVGLRPATQAKRPSATPLESATSAPLR